jgi:hypothetical protein
MVEWANERATEFVLSQQSTNNDQPTTDSPVGAAPTGILYKRNPSRPIGTWRRKWLASRSATSEGWSQSRVLPSAGLAHETCLSAGSIAVLADGHQNLEPSLGIAPSLIRLPSEGIADNALRATEDSIEANEGSGDGWVPFFVLFVAFCSTDEMVRAMEMQKAE